MGKYSDFDLDLNQVKVAESGVSPASDNTLGIICTAISESILKSCTPTCKEETSCNCSASDMTLCGDRGKAGLLRC